MQRMLTIWSLVPLPFLNPSWTPWISLFTYCGILAWRILSISLLACEMSAIVRQFGYALALPFSDLTSAQMPCPDLAGPQPHTRQTWHAIPPLTSRCRGGATSSLVALIHSTRSTLGVQSLCTPGSTHHRCVCALMRKVFLHYRQLFFKAYSRGGGVTLQGLWDLSSLSRNQTQALCSGSAES